MMGPREYETRYPNDLARFKRESPGWVVFEEPVFEAGIHPENFVDYECGFAAVHLKKRDPREILDVGSYRHFTLGLLAHFPVTSIDIRSRKALWLGERAINGDARHLQFPDHSFDAVLSLCALEHFGLGRYGDPFDSQGDRKAFAEMVRVLKPGGTLIFSTTLTRAQPSVAFNAHRIYNHELIRKFCTGLRCVEEKFYSHRLQDFCLEEKVTAEPEQWDVYCGCWQKK